MVNKIVEKMISYCGLVCTTCPVFVATQNNDAAKRKEIAALLVRKYQRILKPENINCDGCRPEIGRHLEGYGNCAIRKCGQAKGVKNCGYCKEYVCEKLAAFPEFSVSCRETLDKVKQEMR